MNIPSNDKLAASRKAIRAFGERYQYDVSYMEALMDASPGAFQAFEAGLGMGRFQKAAPIELLTIAKIVTVQNEDCGPCLALGVKLAREAGVSEVVIRGALQGGKGLNPEQLEIYHYSKAVAANEELDPDVIPRLEERWGREVLAELAVSIAGVRLYPTVKRALGFAKSCALMPELVS